MKICSEINIYGSLYRRQRFVLIPGCITELAISQCLALVSQLDQKNWVQGDQSLHSWKELSGPSLINIQTIVTVAVLEAVLERRVQSSFQWLNVYSSGQFIPGHRDAGGDAHLLACISVPSPTEGGQFWLEQEGHVVPLGAGDALLFEASTLTHGTTPISFGCDAKRVTLSTRLWLAS